MLADDLAAGPLELADVRAIRPMPERPSFTFLVAEGLSNAPGLDDYAQSSRTDFASGATDPTDGFDGAISDALGDALAAPGVAVPETISAALTAGANVDTLHASIADSLPPVDTPLQMDFEGLPPVPHAKTTKPGGNEQNPGEVLSP